MIELNIVIMEAYNDAIESYITQIWSNKWVNYLGILPLQVGFVEVSSTKVVVTIGIKASNLRDSLWGKLRDFRERWYQRNREVSQSVWRAAMLGR